MHVSFLVHLISLGQYFAAISCDHCCFQVRTVCMCAVQVVYVYVHLACMSVYVYMYIHMCVVCVYDVDVCFLRVCVCAYTCSLTVVQWMFITFLRTRSSLQTQLERISLDQVVTT